MSYEIPMWLVTFIVWAMASIAIIQAAREIRRGLESMMNGPGPGQAAPPSLADRIHAIGGAVRNDVDPQDTRERPEYPRPDGANPGSNAESEWLWAIDVVENKGMHSQTDVLEAEEILTKDRVE